MAQVSAEFSPLFTVTESSGYSASLVMYVVLRLAVVSALSGLAGDILPGSLTSGGSGGSDIGGYRVSGTLSRVALIDDGELCLKWGSQAVLVVSLVLPLVLADVQCLVDPKAVTVGALLHQLWVV